MISWKLKKEGNSVVHIPSFGADNIGSKRNAGKGLLGLTKVYMLLRRQTVCCEIFLGDLPWLTHAQRTKMDSPISCENFTCKELLTRNFCKNTRPY